MLKSTENDFEQKESSCAGLQVHMQEYFEASHPFISKLMEDEESEIVFKFPPTDSTSGLFLP